MADEEIGKLNMSQFDSLLKRARLAQNQAKLNAGLIAAMLWNTAPFGDPNRQAKSALDFVPDWQPKTPDLTQMTPEQQLKHLMHVFGDALKKPGNKIIRKPR